MRRITRSRLMTMGALGTLALVTLSACGGDDKPLFPESAAPTSSAAAAAVETTTTAAAVSAPVGSPDAGAIVTTIASPAFGQILGDRDGRTLYVFDNDKTGPQSTCVDQCAANWPPVIANGAPIAAGSVDGTLLSTSPRADGKLQVTYKNLPLYYFKGDTKAGDTLGQGVGGLWHVLDAKGEKVTSGTGTAQGTIITTSNPLGTIVATTDGRTAYAFLKDVGQPQPTCNGECATNWPPVLVEGSPSVGSGLENARLGTVARADGKNQVTYNGMPLYTFSGDTKAGDANGQGVGQVWYVVDPQGNPIGAPAGGAATPAAAPVTTAPAPQATVVPAETDLGTVLADAEGRTVYAFETEKPNLPTPACYDSCADTWPPLVLDGPPVAGANLDPALIGTVAREDGTQQVTYNKWPLYYFGGDRNAGDTNGQGVGQVWFVLGTNGKLVK
jgi:predicted lipoprotein with Yx(FWY)xxD motif